MALHSDGNHEQNQCNTLSNSCQKFKNGKPGAVVVEFVQSILVFEG